MNETLLEVQNIFDDLSKICIESCAATAYNEVIFEAAFSDEILTEADDAKDDKKGSFKSSIANTTFKAIQTLKMFVKNIYNKIRVAINQTIERLSENNAQKAIDKGINKITGKVKIDKDYLIPNAVDVFPMVIPDFKDLIKNKKSEEELAQALAALFNKGLGNNYDEAKKQLAKVDTISGLTKIITSVTSYAEEKQNSQSAAIDVTAWVADTSIVKVTAATKRNYTGSLAKVNDFIKTEEKQLKDASDERAADIKKEVLLAQKVIAVIHAGFIGYLKYSIACNNALIKGIKGRLKDDKKAKQESAFIEFMGLQLL